MKREVKREQHLSELDEFFKQFVRLYTLRSSYASDVDVETYLSFPTRKENYYVNLVHAALKILSVCPFISLYITAVL